jgi:hypothetical protein
MQKQASEQFKNRKQERHTNISKRIQTAVKQFEIELSETRNQLQRIRNRIENEATNLITDIVKEWDMTAKKMSEITIDAKEQISKKCNEKELYETKRSVSVLVFC